MVQSNVQVDGSIPLDKSQDDTENLSERSNIETLK